MIGDWSSESGSVFAGTFSTQYKARRSFLSLGYKLNKVLRKASATEQKGSSLFVFLVLRLTPGQ